MKGLLYYGNKDVRYSEDVEEPQIVNANDVKVKVAFCGICGTDLHEYLEGPIFFPKPGNKNGISGMELPLCPGHEFSGTVVGIGSGVTNVKVGDRVVVEATSHCSDRSRYKDAVAQDLGFCKACEFGHPNCCTDLSFCGLGGASGAFGQYIVYGADHVLPIPDKLPLDIAVLVEPLSVAWHAVERANFQPGQTALVLGGGPIGLATVLALQGHKAGKIVVSEPALIRRQFAEKLGANVFDPTKSENPIADLKMMVPENEGFHASFDCSGVPATYSTSVFALGPSGIAVNVAIWPSTLIDHEPMSLTYQEKLATGSMCYVVKDFQEVIKALDDGLIAIDRARVLITGKVDVKDGIEGGYKQLIEHKESNVKILVAPNGLDA
ncbi:unnamed protein product [Ambrosiozyma monospora]|uniref:Unnamed protein product n=1 Tax=Ambrosiozyma monospora TaxID=43982 RepID=A0A9W6YRI7_AMBMO|nr:unnamed protein product [Ambrosiozyma monospora]